MTYIDDVRDGTEDDLYARSTGQADDYRRPSETPEPTKQPTPVVNVEKPPIGDILDLLYRLDFGVLQVSNMPHLCSSSIALRSS